MKTFLLSSTVFVFVLILIAIFQNIASTMNGVWVLFYQFDQTTSASLGIILISGIGFIAGVLSTALAMTLVNSKDQEEPGGANW
jgi:Kef-type K+ transport system membrane component KefB